MKTSISLLFSILLFAVPGHAGELADKAAGYDAWTPAWHRLGHGAIAETYFMDETLSEVDRFGGRGDSTIWTGTYLASQAFRLMATGDPEAYGEILSTVDTLHHHLQVTGRCGFIARYRGPDLYPYNAGCENDEHCYAGAGEYAGDIFLTNTSRDQYTGWFFGMAMAFDAIDDVDVKALIAEDVAEVVDALIRQRWWIVDVDGMPTTAGPNVLATMQATWSLVAAHVTGEQRFWDEYDRLADPSMETQHRLSGISFMNKYAQHYGNNLGHTNAFTLMTLSRERGLSADYDFWRSLFLDQTHRWTHMIHNAWFELVHWSVLDEPDEAMRASIIDDLSRFRDAPNVHYAVFPPEGPLDPFSVWMDRLQERFPWIAEIIGNVNPQALEPYPVDEQCSTDFLWQRNMWSISCGGGNLRHVDPGVDYLIAYWMARHYGVIDESY